MGNIAETCDLIAVEIEFQELPLKEVVTEGGERNIFFCLNPLGCCVFYNSV